MRRLTAIGPTVIAACLSLAFAGCCCCRDGYTLHGDWSLKLNRCPGTPNACCASAGDCANPGCCEEQCPIAPCPGAPCLGAPCPGVECTDARCALQQPGGQCRGQSGCPAETQVIADAAGRKSCIGKGRKRRAAEVASVPGPTAPSQGHPRFHPVPVRPVFGPVITPQPFVPVPAADPFTDDPEEVPAPAPDGPNARRRAPVKRNPVRTVSNYSNQNPL